MTPSCDDVEVRVTTVTGGDVLLGADDDVVFGGDIAVLISSHDSQVVMPLIWNP